MPVGTHIFQRYNFYNEFHIQKEVVLQFFSKLQKSYPHNPFHNSCHAADVLHTLLYFFNHSSIISGITSFDFLCSALASLGHDSGHPAFTNRFLIQSRNQLAIKYNDTSILENMHSSATYTMIMQTGLFDSFSQQQWTRSREIIIQMILETDMSKHFQILGKFKTRALRLCDLSFDIEEHKIQILAMALKCADLGHSAKPFDVHEKWSYLVCQEFFQQGDMEKINGISVSMYCDRETTDISKSQSGFLKNICIPLYESWCNYLKSDVITSICFQQLQINQRLWEDRLNVRSQDEMMPRRKFNNMVENK